MCIYVLARDAASPWAERSKQIATITSDWSLILHHGLLFMLYTENAKNTSHIRSYQTLLFISLCFFCFLCIGHCGYFFFRLCYDFFLPFCHVMNQILIHALFCPFYTWLCRVHWCWFDCLHMLYCFFCFFFVIDVDNKRPICHSHTVLQKQTSETLPSLETVAPQNAAKSIRRLPDLSDDALMNWTELLCSNWSSFNEVQKRLQPTWTSPTLILFKWHLYFLLCVNLVRVYSDVFFWFFFCRTHSGYSCLSIDSDWPLYFRH